MDYKNIKFRAWHKEQKKMFEVLVLDMNSGEVFLDGFTVETQYKGETQIALKAMKNDGRVNVVGHISPDEQFLLDYLKPWSSFKLVESK